MSIRDKLAAMPDARRPLGLLFFASIAGMLWPVSGLGQVRQPMTNEVMPTMTQAAEIKVVTDRGFPADAVTLEGLFKYRNEQLDPVQDARTEPGVFSPLCGFTGTLLLRGGGCKVAFGWYNVTPGSTTPPPDNQIYELVPANTSVAFQCADMDFCPLATMETTQAPQHSWVPMTFSADNIRSDMRYRGGLIGFALKGTMGSQCPQTKFSQAELNTKNAAGDPWITTLIYPSVATPDAYYVAFEDLPTTQATWKGSTGGLQNDGDFNDFVYFITGLTCEGGGQVCDAAATDPTLTGVCAVGRTGCSVGGAEPACNPVVKPSMERCDNLDNDCDGMVDDGELCPPRQVCDRGTCVQSCTGGEFQCPSGLECNDGGFCVERACKDVMCEAGQVCRAGVCSGGCGPEVKCPFGQECQLGRCIDPCKGTTCGDNQVCEKGVCVSNCSCRPCAAGKACAEMGPDEGRCVESGCESKSCAAGERCVAGNCVSACDDVSCPGNAMCMNGECGDPLPPEPVGGTGGGPPVVIPPIPSAGTSNPNPGGSGGSGSGPPPVGTAGTGTTTRNAPESSCGCRVPGQEQAPAWLGLGALAALVGVARVRRRRDRRPQARGLGSTER